MDINTKTFLALVQAGLWGNKVRFTSGEGIDWQEVYRLATEQSVLGLVLAGLEHCSLKPPQLELLQWIGEVQVIEQQNKAMNVFVAEIFEWLRKGGVVSLLVKGQGIAQCYEKPLWRASGDVDLFLIKENYDRALPLLASIAESVDEENESNRHIAMTIEGWTVEMHGTLRSGLWKKIDHEIDKIQDSVFFEGEVRSWMNGSTQISLPAPDEDVVFVFSHILQHFYKEGIGLRQICDWCRLLWMYKDFIDTDLLEKRIRAMGVMTEWKAFGALAVDYLAIPSVAMPFYSSSWHCLNKAEKVMRFVLETGNFGHNRDYSYMRKYSYVIYKAISAWKHLQDFCRYFVIFPLDAVKVTRNRMCQGISVAFKGKKQKYNYSRTLERIYGE